MNRTLPVLALCVSLLALAVGVASLEKSPPPPPPVEVTRQGPSDEVLELRKRVELLEDESRSLWDRLVVLERRDAMALSSDAGLDPTQAAAMMAELNRLRDELHQLAATQPLSGDAGRAALADAIRDINAQQARERILDRMDRMQNRTVEFAQKWRAFSGTARLSSAQEKTLQDRLMIEEQAQKAAFSRTDGMPSMEAFRSYNQQRRETDRLMRDQLDDAQYEQFQSMRREERGDRGGGRREAP